MRRKISLSLLASLGLLTLGAWSAGAEVVYSNDFESGLAGTTAGGVTAGPLTPGGTIAGKTLVAANLGLLAPNAGTANNSNWLAHYDTGSSGPTNGIGGSVNKSNVSDETISLTLSGLVAGTTYNVDFDLIIRSSWDGAAGGFGPDRWFFAVDGTRLVDTAFSNVNNGAFSDPSPNAGAYSPQRYTDTFYTGLGTAANDVNRYTGADAFRRSNGTQYAEGYGIYWFGHGVGNPELSFLATSSTATLTWARASGVSDSGDENWSIDNVSVSGVIPEPGSAVVTLLGLGGCALRRRRVAR